MEKQTHHMHPTLHPAHHSTHHPTHHPTLQVSYPRQGRQEIFTTSVDLGSTGEMSVIREQYCLCAPRTKLEKNLIIAVGVMGITIVVLLIALALVLDQNCDGYLNQPPQRKNIFSIPKRLI